MPDTDLTKLAFNAVPRAMAALHVAADQAGLSRTETANRALQLYAALIGVSWWRAIQILFQERAQVRKFAADPKPVTRPNPPGGKT